MPSTVVISTVKPENGFVPDIAKTRILGTGVVVDGEGYILTSEHVIHGFNNVEIVTFQGKRYYSEVLFSSVDMDLALIKVREPDSSLKPVKLSFPEDLLLAEPVIAIGNPFGLTFSISDGILSSTGRSLKANNNVAFDNLLQTSIKVNPGNSGGPLINMKGEMIGLMVASQTEAQGIGFALPVSKIEKIMSSWFSPERQAHAELGFEVVSEFDQEKRKGYATVRNVRQGKLNNLLGIRNGQKIVKVDDVEIRNAMDFYRYIKNKKVGAQLSIQTFEGRNFFVQLFPLKGLTLAKSKLGLKFQRLGPEIARAISLPFDKGFVLSGIDVDVDLNLLKIRRGDMLFKVNNKPVLRDEDFQMILKNAKSGDRLPVVFFRVIPEGGNNYHVKPVNDYIIVR